MALRKKKPPEEAGGGDAWLATYGDMVTLLLTFFVLLFAISQIDVQKFNLLAAALSNRGASPEEIMEIAEQSSIKNLDEISLEDPKAPLDEDANPLQEAFDSIVESIQASGMADKVTALLGDDFIFIRFIDDMLFEPNSARIRQQDYTLLEMIGRSLKLVENDIGMIRIDGHTAALPENPDYHVSDRDLSSERANSVLKYLEDSVGIRGDRLSALAFGKHRPIASNDDEEERKKNRRIEIMITEANDITMQLDAIYERLID
ncbi:MAG: flagellar motor protein MotB [Oscillospiraceae bacterium]|nr:flagellar motor protein MotB [Oscillospiraceae bacterium]